MKHTTKVKVTGQGNYQVSFSFTEKDPTDGNHYNYHVQAVITTKRGRNCNVIVDLAKGKILLSNKLFKILDNKVYKEPLK